MIMAEPVAAFAPGERFITIDEHGDARLWTVKQSGLVKIISNGDTVAAERTYSVREISQLLHVSTRTVFARIKSGELHSYKSGGARRVTQADLDAYRAAH